MNPICFFIVFTFIIPILRMDSDTCSEFCNQSSTKNNFNYGDFGDK